MNAALRAWANVLRGQMELPGGRFFTPTDAFFAWMDTSEHRALQWIEAGAGSGELAQALLDRGFHLIAVDVSPREDQLQCVERLDACDLTYRPDRWALVCRPNHNGWVEDLIEQVHAGGATLVYVGLTENLERDLGEHADRARCVAQDVGEQGEAIWVLPPLRKAQ